MAKKTVTKKRVSKPTTKNTATSIYRVPPGRQQIELVIHDPRGMMPAPAAAPVHLTDEVIIGSLGTVELKLTPEEELVLSEPVLDAEVLVKPTDAGVVYLSHPTYTKWFNRAFGRTGWTLVPVSKPSMLDNEISVDYMLYIHRQPVAYAKGAQEYHASNKEQTYADAYEATQASALRRVAKRLGVGLELWDKRWCDSFLDRVCVKIWNDEKKKFAWRRKDDRPFWWEKQTQRQERQAPPQRTYVNTTTGEETSDPAPRNVTPQRRALPPAQQSGDDIITNVPRTKDNTHVGQVQRLAIIIKESGRDVDSVKAWMAVAYGYGSTRDIKRKDYDAICTAIQRPGPLPAPEGREPGQEG